MRPFCLKDVPNVKTVGSKSSFQHTIQVDGQSVELEGEAFLRSAKKSYYFYDSLLMYTSCGVFCGGTWKTTKPIGALGTTGQFMLNVDN